MAPYAQSEEEANQERLLRQRQQELTEKATQDLLDDPDKGIVIHEVLLRTADINAALHAMALHKMSPLERVKVVNAKWVRVLTFGDTRCVEFLKSAPTATEEAR
jgi:hypothetical protein